MRREKRPDSVCVGGHLWGNRRGKFENMLTGLCNIHTLDELGLN